MKIKPTETVIDSDWWIKANNLTEEEGREVSRRILFLTEKYLKQIFDDGWEKLYQDSDDLRYWELTYPRSEWHGGGPPLLRYLTDEEAIARYKIDFRYIPELKPKPTEKVIDHYELVWSNDLNLIEAHEIFFRISWLMQYYFEEILKISDEVILYRDPGDYRYWELTYPRGYNYGSGYRYLKYLTDDEVANKYNIKP